MLYRSNIDNNDDNGDDDDDDDYNDYDDDDDDDGSIHVSIQYTSTTIYSWAEFLSLFLPVQGNVLTPAVTSYSFTY